MERSVSSMIQKLFLRMQNTTKHRQWDIGLTNAQIRVLMFLGQQYEKGTPTYQKDIEHEFGIKGSSATSLLNNLEKNNWIRRESVEHDARLKSIVFSERAVSIMSRFRAMTDRIDGFLRSGLTDEEFEVFCRCMDKMVLSIDEHSSELSRSIDELVDSVRQ